MANPLDALMQLLAVLQREKRGGRVRGPIPWDDLLAAAHEHLSMDELQTQVALENLDSLVLLRWAGDRTVVSLARPVACAASRRKRKVPRRFGPGSPLGVHPGAAPRKPSNL